MIPTSLQQTPLKKESEAPVIMRYTPRLFISPMVGLLLPVLGSSIGRIAEAGAENKPDADAIAQAVHLRNVHDRHDQRLIEQFLFGLIHRLERRAR